MADRRKADEKEAGDESSSPGGASELTEGLTEVMSSALGVGASMARAFARATAGEREMREPPSDRPLEVLVHYSLASVTNVVGLVSTTITGVAGQASRAAGTGTGAAGEEARPGKRTSELPSVPRGGELRLPLSVENPGTEPMSGLGTVVASVAVVEEAGSPGQGAPLERRHVRTVPEVLNIAPRDFEKLTVLVQTEPDTAAATYEAAIHLGSPNFTTRVRFSVVPAEDR